MALTPGRYVCTSNHYCRVHNSIISCDLVFQSERGFGLESTGKEVKRKTKGYLEQSFGKTHSKTWTGIEHSEKTGQGLKGVEDVCRWSISGLFWMVYIRTQHKKGFGNDDDANWRIFFSMLSNTTLAIAEFLTLVNLLKPISVFACHFLLFLIPRPSSFWITRFFYRFSSLLT